VLPPHRRLLVLLIGNYPYYKMGRLKIVLIVLGKGQKPHRNYMENFIREIYNPII